MQINFYILSEQRQLMTFVCQLVQTVLQKSHDGILILSNTDELPIIDDLLWTFESTSFIPHEVITGDTIGNTAKSPVILTDKLAFTTRFDGIIVNLTENGIFQSPADKILEIIDSNPIHTEKGRAKFRQYRDIFPQVAIQTFKIN